MAGKTVKAPKTERSAKASRAGKVKEEEVKSNPLEQAGSLKAEEKTEVDSSAKEEKEKVKEVVRVVDIAKRLCGCCAVNPTPLPPGQKYFEAPADGHLIVGEEKVSQVWDRRGKGNWINPKR